MQNLNVLLSISLSGKDKKATVTVQYKAGSKQQVNFASNFNLANFTRSE